MKKLAFKGFHGTGAKTGSRGVTLVELVIVIVVTGIIVIAISPFIRVTIKSYLTVRTGKEILQMSRIGFNTMASEIRRIQAVSDIWYADSDELEFRYLKSDGTFTASRVKYSFNSNGRIDRVGPGSPNSRLMEGVSAFKLKFYNKTGSAFTPGYSTGNIWRIEISATVGADENQTTFSEQIFPKAFGAY
jgi:hypothetical protein